MPYESVKLFLLGISSLSRLIHWIHPGNHSKRGNKARKKIFYFLAENYFIINFYFFISLY